ncbi:MAG: hypothetical protein ABR520_06520, partial [Mycobacteriales bacterium]
MRSTFGVVRRTALGVALTMAFGTAGALATASPAAAMPRKAYQGAGRHLGWTAVSPSVASPVQVASGV